MAWPRRNRGMGSPREGSVIIGRKSVLGGPHLHRAKAKIESLCQRSIKVMAPFDHDLKAVLPWCFSQDTLVTLKHAHELVKLHAYYGGLATNGTYQITEGTSVEIEFDTVPMLAPRKEMFNIDPVAGKPLLDAIDQIRVIKNKFDLAEHVLNWLDGHVTAGAMRYYWPTALSLAPQAPTLAGEIPSRHNTPDGIAPWLPLIRESSGTIASALMLAEDVETDPKKGMALKLSGGGMRIGDDTLSAIHRTIPI